MTHPDCRSRLNSKHKASNIHASTTRAYLERSRACPTSREFRAIQARSNLTRLKMAPAASPRVVNFTRRDRWRPADHSVAPTLSRVTLLHFQRPQAAFALLTRLEPGNFPADASRLTTSVDSAFLAYFARMSFWTIHNDETYPGAPPIRARVRGGSRDRFRSFSLVFARFHFPRRFRWPVTALPRSHTPPPVHAAPAAPGGRSCESSRSCGPAWRPLQPRAALAGIACGSLGDSAPAAPPGRRT
jgi:hypothetical protein